MIIRKLAKKLMNLYQASSSTQILSWGVTQGIRFSQNIRQSYGLDFSPGHGQYVCLPEGQKICVSVALSIRYFQMISVEV